MWAVLAGAVIVAIAGAAIFFATRGDAAEATGPDGSSCVRQTFPPMGRQHIEKLSSDFRYNSYPPTSGPHYPPGPKAPAVWNLYDTPVDETALVHNLEHGGVVIQYGADVPQSTVEQIANWYQADPNGIVVAPIWPSIQATPPKDAGKKIFLTAWTHLMTCTAFDEGAFTRFRDDYRGPTGDAPEKFPLNQLVPGGQ